MGGRAGLGELAGGSGRLCVLAKWEVMLLTESWGCCSGGLGWGEVGGCEGELLSLKDPCPMVGMLS